MEWTSCDSIFFFQAEDGIRDGHVTGVQTCALPICRATRPSGACAAPSRRGRDVPAAEWRGGVAFPPGAGTRMKCEAQPKASRADESDLTIAIRLPNWLGDTVMAV